MGTPDSAILEDLIQRQLDEDLSPQEERKLEQHLRASADLRRERAELRGVVSLLEGGRIPVREEFHRQVLENLPPAGWEGRSARSWQVPAAVLAGLAVLGAVLARTAQPSTGSIAGALSAALELLVTAAITGFGLLGASWKGLQAIFQGLGAGSPWAMVGLVVLVLGLNLLLYIALRPRPRLLEATKEGDSPASTD